MKVNETPYSAQYGGFSAGLTTSETKRPADLWHFGLMTLFREFEGWMVIL
jgi:hypothetical protein